jgi:hypothetical protein
VILPALLPASNLCHSHSCTRGLLSMRLHVRCRPATHVSRNRASMTPLQSFEARSYTLSHSPQYCRVTAKRWKSRALRGLHSHVINNHTCCASCFCYSTKTTICSFTNRRLRAIDNAITVSTAADLRVAFTRAVEKSVWVDGCFETAMRVVFLGQKACACSYCRPAHFEKTTNIRVYEPSYEYVDPRRQFRGTK